MREKIAVSFGEKTKPDKREPYLAALRSVGIDFVENPPAIEGFGGLLLTGGTDVDPALYGEDRHPESETPDKDRDIRDATLLGEALARDIPILAICRGLQVFNVVLGGTLTQHIEGHRWPGQLDAHSVDIRRGTKLGSILKAGEYRVNSRHHQCVDELGKDLVTSATAPDGIIEALELPGKNFAIAVQWHPEDRLETPDRKLFQAFAEAIHAVTQRH